MALLNKTKHVFFNILFLHTIKKDSLINILLLRRFFMFPMSIIKPNVNKITEYDQFRQDMATAIASGSVTEIGSNVDTDITTLHPGKVKFYFEYTLGSPTNIMYGSPFTTFFKSSGAARICQHGLQPSVYPWYVQNSGACYFEIAAAGSNLLAEITRNGYTSWSSAGESFRCSVFVYYDASTGLMMRYNPHTNSTPVPYYN